MIERTTLVDDQGRVTLFDGDLLLSTSTDDPVKPKWVDIEVWRTNGGNWVVRRATHHRLNHASEYCESTRGQEVEQTDPDDVTLGCSRCGGQPGTIGWRIVSRITVDTYMSTKELVESFKRDGVYSQLGRTILSDLSRLDNRVWALWMETVVP